MFVGVYVVCLFVCLLEAGPVGCLITCVRSYCLLACLLGSFWSFVRLLRLELYAEANWFCDGDRLSCYGSSDY